MLLLVTIGLVLVGAVALVIGFVSNSLGPIYLSIACSVIAGIVLVVFSRMARRQESAGTATATAAGPTPEPARSSWASRSSAEAPTEAMSTTGTASEPALPKTPPPPRPGPVSRPEPARTMTAPETAGATATLTAPRPAPADDLDFPIEGYDGLRASQILAELDGLSLDELDMVREREEQGKKRATIIKQVDLRIDRLEAEEDGPGPIGSSDGPLPNEFPVAAAGEFPENDEDALLAETVLPGAADAQSGAATDGEYPDAHDDFPIANYDSLSAAEIISMLDDLDDDELDMVAEREEQGKNRVEILDYIDGMFEEVGPDGMPVSSPVVTPPPAPRPAVKKAPVKKAAVKKASVKPVKKAAVTKAGLTKAAATKAAAAKGAGTRGSAAKAAGKVAPTTKVAAKAGPGRSAAAAAGSPIAKKTAGAPASPGSKSAGRRSPTGAAKLPPVPRAAAKRAASTKAPAKRATAVKKR